MTIITELRKEAAALLALADVLEDRQKNKMDRLRYASVPPWSVNPKFMKLDGKT